MITKRLFIFALIMYFLIHQRLSADELCNPVMAETVKDFTTLHFDEWEGTLRLQILFSPNTADEDNVFVLGNPFQIYTIAPENIQNYLIQNDFEAVLTQRGVWYVPVSTSMTTRALEVHCQDGNLTIVGVAGSQIAESVDKLSKQIDLTLTQNWVVRIETFNSLFLALAGDTETLIYPLIAFPEQYALLKPVDDLGGYKASEVLFLLATKFLETAHPVNITADLSVHIPYAV